METITNWTDLTFNALNEMGIQIMGTLPNIVGAILILVIGWLITKLILMVLKRVLKFTKVDKLTDLINENNIFGNTDVKFNTSKVILSFVKWILFLVFLIVAADIMNWKIVSIEIGKLISYLPKLFSAIALFMIGLYIANFVKKAIKGLFDSLDLIGAKAISSLVFYVVVIIITVTALNQAGIQTEIITNNLTIILGAFLGALALGLGLGSKDIVGNLLHTFFTKKNFEIGQKINCDDVSGTIESIENMTMTVKTIKGKVVLPIKDVVSSQILIKD